MNSLVLCIDCIGSNAIHAYQSVLIEIWPLIQFIEISAPSNRSMLSQNEMSLFKLINKSAVQISGCTDSNFMGYYD